MYLKTQAKLEFYKDDHLKARVACEIFTLDLKYAV